jgi:hypothetical protein
MIKLLIILGYILIGAVLLGLLYYTAATKESFKDFYDYIGLLDSLEDDKASVIGISVMFATFWPLLLLISLAVVPYMYIKYMFDKKWGKKLWKKPH